MPADTKRLLAALASFLWMALILAAYYITQKNTFLTGIHGLAAIGWVLVVWAILVTNAAGISFLLIRHLPELSIQPVERLLLSTGIGLGFLGLAGFPIGILGWTHPALLIGFQLSLLLLLCWRKALQAVWDDLRCLGAAWRDGMASAPRWLKIAAAGTLILLSMPSLYLLASWAYTDFSLTFYGLAAIYAVHKTFDSNGALPHIGWIVIAGIGWGHVEGGQIHQFSGSRMRRAVGALEGSQKLGVGHQINFDLQPGCPGVAAPWYLRSWIVMGNPFCPFAFGGLYWDSFRAAWYAEAGTGIGWQLKEILLQPLNATLGHRDANYYDGRIGPLYLVLAPLSAYVLLKAENYPGQKRRVLLAITLFSLLSIAAWILGVINSAALWQTRLLLPALIPFALPTALGLLAVKNPDTPPMRLSFIYNFVVIAVVVVAVIVTGIRMITRNPLAYAVGYQTRQAYLAKMQPSDTQAIQSLESTPQDASI